MNNMCGSELQIDGVELCLLSDLGVIAVTFCLGAGKGGVSLLP